MKKRKRVLYPLAIFSMSLFSFSTTKSKKNIVINNTNYKSATIFSNTDSLYIVMQLESHGLSKEAFSYAIKGWNLLKEQGKIINEHIISIIDFTLPSDKKRLFVLNIETNELVFNTYVAHGKNSGNKIASAFSNKTNSYKSSLGFYVTESVYSGKHGYSLRLNGEEKGINDHAFQRGIVMHGASYVNELLANKQGFIGRSQGCPAIPSAQHKEIIDHIKNGSCLFIYANDKHYLSHSAFLQSDKKV